MSVMPDHWIRKMSINCGDRAMIVPFESGQVKVASCCERDHNKDGDCDRHRGPPKKIVSYGTSSYGYDMRVADEFKVFTPAWTKNGEAVVDPKNLDEGTMVDFKGEVCRVPPNSFALARSVEKFRIPRDILAVVLGKSTYARCGIVVNVTPLEPEWEGHVTIEISNTTPLPAKIYANEGIAQVLFLKADSVCETSYADKGGKYQGQGPRVYLPKV